MEGDESERRVLSGKEESEIRKKEKRLEEIWHWERCKDCWKLE
jgi:hypothetical protein